VGLAGAIQRFPVFPLSRVGSAVPAFFICAPTSKEGFRSTPSLSKIEALATLLAIGAICNKLKERTMTIGHSIIPELEHEIATTKKYIDRLPADKLDWKPTEKSMAMGRLAQHIVEMVGWGAVTINTPELELSGFKPTPVPAPSVLAAELEKNCNDFKSALAIVADAEMMQPWSLKMNGNPVFTMPRLVVLRSMILNHLIHHRGQLAAYYKICGVPVPATYGPSGDESN
jgi:uncharacterized damage-inducible protein DinB